jgi:hypothetical protein
METFDLDAWVMAWASPIVTGFVLGGIIVFAFDLAWKYVGLLKEWREDNSERESD